MIRNNYSIRFVTIFCFLIMFFILGCSGNEVKPAKEAEEISKEQEPAYQEMGEAPQVETIQRMEKAQKTNSSKETKKNKQEAELVNQEWKDPQHIILITVDSLRYDTLGCYGNKEIKTPAMDSLASDGILFERCITPNPQDLPAHCAMMTGIYPEKLGVFDNAIFKLPERFATIAEILKENGFRTAAFVGSSVLDKRFGLSQGFDDYIDHFDSLLTNTLSLFSERYAEEVIEKVLDYLKNKKNGKKLFLWIHLNDPNYYFRPPAPFEESYEGEVEYTDSQISRLLSFLKSKGIYSNSIIILASDHGMSLGDHNEKKYGIQLYESSVRVPLIIKPHTDFKWKEKKVSQTTGLIDIAPSLLYLASLDEKKIKVDGHNLFENPGEIYWLSSNHQFFAFGWSIRRAVYDGEWKYIGGGGKQELYNIQESDKERMNQLEKNKEIAEHLERKIKEFEKEMKTLRIEDNRPIHDFFNTRNLASIGYSWCPASSMSTSKKGKFEILSELEDFLEEAQFGALNKGFRKYRKFMRKINENDPENYTALLYIAAKHVYGGRKEKADAALSKLEELYPDRAETYHLKGHWDYGEKVKALESFQMAIAIDPLHAEALYDSACLYSLQGKKKEAFKFLDKAIQAGFNDLKHIEQDPDLMNIRDSAQFKEILEKYKEQ